MENVSPAKGSPEACVAGTCQHHPRQRTDRSAMAFARHHPRQFATADLSSAEQLLKFRLLVKLDRKGAEQHNALTKTGYAGQGRR